MIDGYMEREWQAWERTRVIAAEVHNVFRKRRISPQQYMALPTDKQKATQPKTKQEQWHDFLKAKERFGDRSESER